MKSNVSTQKLSLEETLQQEKTRIKREEEKKQQEVEDRLRALSNAKDELEVNFALLRKPYTRPSISLATTSS